MAWSAKRKLLHAEMLGAHHEAKEEQMDEEAAGGWDGDAQYDQSADVQRAARQAGVDTSDMPGASEHVPNSPHQGQRGDPTQRHETSWDVSDDDTEWEFCSQCQGLFDPADNEYEAHFDLPGFDCRREAAE